MMSTPEVMQEFRAVCALISDTGVTDAEVSQAVAGFKAIEAPAALKAECLAAIGETMEQRSPGHLADRRTGV